MTIRKLVLIATTAVTVVLLPPILPHASAQNNPTVSNVIPEGGHYSIRGKLQGIDPAANTLTLAADKAGTIPIVIGPQAEGDIAHVSVGDVVDVTYTRTVTFILASSNVNVSNVPANTTVGQVAQAGGIGANPTTLVGRVTKVDSNNHSFDVVNANGGGVYTVLVTNPIRQQALTLLKAGDSVTVDVGPLVAQSVAKCGLFGMGLLGC
ncbi:MAG: hypothetical protein ACJ8AW_45120 [Rhodopila sp.]